MSAGWRGSTRRRSGAFPAAVSPESARAAPAAGGGTLKRFIRVYPCSSVANGLRTRAALMVAFGGVARQAAQRGDRFVVFEAVERAFGRLGVLHGARPAVVEAALRVDRGDDFGQRVDVAMFDDRAQTFAGGCIRVRHRMRSEEHTSELQSLMRISYAVFCLKKKKTKKH